MTSTTVYPDRDQLVVELAVGGGIAALVGFLLLDSAWEALFGNGLGDLGGVAATAVFVFAILIIFPAVHLLGLRGAVDAARELRHPLPLVCLDGDGFECSAGRVRWRDVERITTTGEHSDTLVFHLTDGAQPESTPRASEYLDHSRFSPRRHSDWTDITTGPQVTMPFWTAWNRPTAINVIRQFYDGPTSGPISKVAPTRQAAEQDTGQP